MRPGNAKASRKATDLERAATADSKRIGLDLEKGNRTIWCKVHQVCKSGRWQLPVAILFTLLYFFLAAVFYSEVNGWSYSASLYYAAQTGWSVGFGVLVEDSDESQWFTIFFVLIGASIIGGAVAVLIALVLEKQSEWKAEVRSDILVREGTRGLLNTQTSAHDRATASPSRFIQYICRMAKEFKDEYQTELRCALAFIAWIGAGVIYGMVEERWSFVTSLYFSVTSLSTGGLKTANINPDKDTFTNWFMAFWIMTGVPVFGIAVGQLAGVLVESYMRFRLHEKLNAEVKEEEFQYACMLDLTTGSTQIRFGEFLEFSLLRAGLVQSDVLRNIRDRFAKMDIDQSGTITIKEMRACLEFDRFDVDGDGTISIAEFVAICNTLGIGGPSTRDKIKIFQMVDADNSESITRKEFLNWYYQRHASDLELTQDEKKLEDMAKEREKRESMKAPRDQEMMKLESSFNLEIPQSSQLGSEKPGSRVTSATISRPTRHVRANSAASRITEASTKSRNNLISPSVTDQKSFRRWSHSVGTESVAPYKPSAEH